MVDDQPPRRDKGLQKPGAIDSRQQENKQTHIVTPRILGGLGNALLIGTGIAFALPLDNPDCPLQGRQDFDASKQK